ncbi:MAG: hypothetical protein AABY22_05380 [Nanoarchaeota archaeon]
MITNIQIIECFQCEKQRNNRVELEKISSNWRAIPEWIEISNAGYWDYNHLKFGFYTKHFCSFNCLKEYVNRILHKIKI